jgi:hypothetical protein
VNIQTAQLGGWHLMAPGGDQCNGQRRQGGKTMQAMEAEDGALGSLPEGRRHLSGYCCQVPVLGGKHFPQLGLPLVDVA